MVTKVGTNGNNLLSGTNGNDLLKGLGGNDDLFGLGGNDQLYGGSGNDKLFGAGGNDTLWGDAGNDILNGGPGTDELLGGAGSDMMLPGQGGFDAIDGGPGFDFVSYANVSGAIGGTFDNVNFGPGHGQGTSGVSLGDSYSSIEGFIGSPNPDIFELAAGNFGFGGGGGDIIYSHFGATMRGDAGMDTLFGTGSGTKDTFILQRNLGADSIERFDSGEDRLQIRRSDFAVGALLNTNELVNDASGHDPVGAFAQFIYDQNSDQLWYDANGTGAGGAVHMATFLNTAPTALLVGYFDLV